MKFAFSGQIFAEVSNNEFHQNPISGSRVVPCEQMDMTMLTVAFRNFANAPKNQHADSLSTHVFLSVSTANGVRLTD